MTPPHSPSPAHQSPATQPASEKRVTGIGGIFFKCKDPAAMKKWYADHLGLKTDDWGTNFETRQSDRPDRKSFTQWSPFPETTKYFGQSTRPFMINYRVENLEKLVAQLKAEGVTVIDPIKQETYGKFVHIVDLEGGWIELWEPNDAEYEKIVPEQSRTK